MSFIFDLRLVQYVGLALMLGLLFLGQGTDFISIQNRFSLLFFANAFLVFMSIAALPFLIGNRIVFVRERTNGNYGEPSPPHARCVAAVAHVELFSWNQASCPTSLQRSSPCFRKCQTLADCFSKPPWSLTLSFLRSGIAVIALVSSLCLYVRAPAWLCRGACPFLCVSVCLCVFVRQCANVPLYLASSTVWMFSSVHGRTALGR